MKPQAGFEPLGYSGNPASYKLDNEFVPEFLKVMTRDGANTIERVVREKKK